MKLDTSKLTICTGGQSGVDQVALEVAFSHGVRTGGFVPKGYLTERGSEPFLKKYGVIELPSAKYGPRTAANVNLADAIVIFGRTSSPGTSLTQQLAKKMRKPMLVNPSSVDELRDFMAGRRVVMIAGNRLSTGAEYADRCKAMLSELFKASKKSDSHLAARAAFDAAFLAGFQSTDSEWNGEIDNDGDISNDERFLAQRNHAYDAYVDTVQGK